MNGAELLLTHASLDTFMSDAANRGDVEGLVDNAVRGERRDLVTFTETADPATVAMIRHVAGDTHRVVNPDAGDITFVVDREHEVLTAGGRLVVPAVHKPAREGGHGPRFVSHVTIRVGLDELTHNGVHFVTKRAGGRAVDDDRARQQRRQARVMGVLMREQGRGRRLATGSGDLNAVLPQDQSLQRVFNDHGLTTTAHETGVNTPTEGASRIDYVWTRDADRRLKVEDMVVRRGAAWHSDHDPIDVWLKIRSAR